MPVTTPVALMVATLGVTLDHTPPVVVLDKVVVLPTHAVKVPLIGEMVGNALIVTVALTESTQPFALVTV